jgi:hypothetical protein
MTNTRPRKKKPLPVQQPIGQQEPALGGAKLARAARLRPTSVFLALLLMVAVGLRVANLTGQSLWADEGNSVRVTERSLDLVVAAARGDVHPPGYYVLLWGWVRLFGNGETAVRTLSAVIGLALVGLVYLAALSWFGARAAWLAAFCAAVSPFQVAYSQEVRMYILVAFCGMAAAYSWGRYIAMETSASKSRWFWGAAYVLATAGGLWTHYSFPIVLVALNVAWLVWWLWAGRPQKRWRAALAWLGMHGLVLVLYAPWLSVAVERILGYGPISAPKPVSFIVVQALKLLSVGETVPGDGLTRWLTLAMVGLALLGLWGALDLTARKRSGEARRKGAYRVVVALALSLLVLAPIVMMSVLTLGGRPAYRPKFFLVASPAFCILVGLGIARLEGRPSERRTLANQLWLLLGMGLVAFAGARSLRNYYSNPAYARTDYRGIAQAIRRENRAGDAILLNAPNQWEVFTYYYAGPAPVYPLPRSRPPQEEAVHAELGQIAAEHRRLYALYWATAESDPKRIVERWLEANTFKASDEWIGDVRLVVYAVPEELGAVEMEQRLEDVRLGEAIALRGYSLSPEGLSAGDILQIALFWEALGIPGGRYKVFVHLLDEQGAILTQYDGEPGHGLHLTTGWTPESGVFPDRYGILIPQGTKAGEYALRVGMYDVSGEPRLPVFVSGESAGDSFSLGVVRVH